MNFFSKQTTPVLKIAFFSMILCCFSMPAQAQLSPKSEQDIAAIRISTNNSQNYLKQIQDYTRQILEKLNNSPLQINEFIQSWLAKDKSDFTKSAQTDFATLGNQINQAQAAQYDNHYMSRLNQSLLYQNNKAPDSKAIPYANDLVYSSLFNIPIIPEPRKSVDSPYNYLGNLSGIFIPHKIPNLNWSKQNNEDNSIEKYFSYYSTVIAAESFDASVLARLYASDKNPQESEKLKTRMNLVKKASDPNWFTQIANQELGIVLRQMLLFQAQTYVLLTDLLDTQKQILTAQVIQNSLQIQNGQQTENNLYLTASGKIKVQ